MQQRSRTQFAFLSWHRVFFMLLSSLGMLASLSTSRGLRMSISGSKVGSKLSTPATIQAMMRDVGKSINACKAEGKPLVSCYVPLPVTGGTELDDWPGGIAQKFNTLQPMLQETLLVLNFSKSAREANSWLGENGEEDYVGFWQDDERGVKISAFATTDTITAIKSQLQPGTCFALLNQQIFIDMMSSQDAKDFASSLFAAYVLESLNVKGPNALPVRGLLYRQFPGDWLAARRLEGDAGYVVLASWAERPPREEIERVFFDDSVQRDKNLTFLQRLQKQVPNFGN